MFTISASPVINKVEPRLSFRPDSGGVNYELYLVPDVEADRSEERRTTSKKDESAPTAKCLLNRLKQVERFLRRKGYSQYVIERAIDRVVWAAVPYVADDPEPCPFENRVKWLFGIARMAAKQEASRVNACDFLDPKDLPAIAQSDDSDTVKRVWAALDKLTPAQRTAVYLCDMLGRSLQEAADEMGCSSSNVKRLRDKARKRLRSLLT